MRMKRIALINFELACELDSLEEADNIDIPAFIDDWLDSFTSSCPSGSERARSRIFTMMDRDRLDCGFGFKVLLEDDLWDDWNDRLEELCLEWLSNPANLSRVDSGIAAELDTILNPLRAGGIVPERNLVPRLWKELSFQARREIGLKASADKICSPEREHIREHLVRLHTKRTQEYRKDMDDSIKSYQWKSIVLIEQSSNTICAQGIDMSDAIERLSGFMLPDVIMKPIPHDTAGDGVYHAFRVPEFMRFDPEDAGLVERWGTYEGSFVNVASQAR
jgi:hypothetical protein